MSVAWVGAAVSAVGVVSGAQSASKARKQQQQQADAALAQADRSLEAQMKQADEVLAFNKQVYNDGQIRQVKLDDLTSKVVDQQMAIQKDQADRATDSYNFYQSQGRPMVQRAFDDANQYDSEENLAAARGRAQAGVQQQFDAAAGQTQRALQRMGINPNSGKFLALQQQLQTQKALATAGAANNADEQRRQGAIGLRQGAANLAQGFPAQSTGQANSSVGAGSAAVGGNGAIAAQNNALSGMALNGMGSAAGIYGSAASGYNNLFGSVSNNMNAIGQNANANMAGWGNMLGTSLSGLQKSWGSSNSGNAYTGTGSTGSGVGNAGAGDYSNLGQAFGYANGGQIKGPGTGTSDSVPAVNKDTGGNIMLSNGEYIVPADVVRAKGVEFFDKLKQKHHKHVPMNGNLGRGQ